MKRSILATCCLIVLCTYSNFAKAMFKDIDNYDDCVLDVLKNTGFGAGGDAGAITFIRVVKESCERLFPDSKPK